MSGKKGIPGTTVGDLRGWIASESLTDDMPVVIQLPDKFVHCFFSLDTICENIEDEGQNAVVVNVDDLDGDPTF